MTARKLTPRRYLAAELRVLGNLRRKAGSLPVGSRERSVLVAWEMTVRLHVKRLRLLIGPDAAEMCAAEHFQGGGLLP